MICLFISPNVCFARKGGYPPGETIGLLIGVLILFYVIKYWADELDKKNTAWKGMIKKAQAITYLCFSEKNAYFLSFGNYRYK